MKIYGLYADDGTLVDTGSAPELEEKYYVNESWIRNCARNGRKLCGQYTVRVDGERMHPGKQEKLETITRLHNKGLNTVQISEVSGITRGTVSRYLAQMKKEGVVT